MKRTKTNSNIAGWEQPGMHSVCALKDISTLSFGGGYTPKNIMGD